MADDTTVERLEGVFAAVVRIGVVVFGVLALGDVTLGDWRRAVGDAAGIGFMTCLRGFYRSTTRDARCKADG